MYTVKNKYKIILSLVCILLTTLPTLAQDTAATAATAPSPYATLRYSLLAVGIILVFVIMVLANITKITGQLYLTKQKKGDAASVTAKATSVLLVLFSLPMTLFAQDEVVEVVKPSLPTDLYFYFTIIAVELLVIFFLARMIYGFLQDPNKEVLNLEKPSRFLFLKKMLRPQPIEVQEKLDLEHDYDGIRELDNDIPKWWKLAFAGTILFAVVYLFRMFITNGIPTQLEELTAANIKADEAKLAYLLKASDDIDENNVAVMTGADLVDGRELYVKNCVACHADNGGGGVGPNLTDDKWVHKGELGDIFYSIKYGWEEKGMRPWINDFSPKQIAQLTNYIKSLENTNVAGGKDPEGE